MKGREPRRGEARQRIMDSFSTLASSRSYFYITINDIARQAGISTSSFYTYYNSKYEPLLSFMDYSLGRLADIIGGRVGGLEDPPLIIRGMLSTLANLYQDRHLKGFHRVLRELEFVDLKVAAKYYREVLKLLSRHLRGAGSPPLSGPVPDVVAMMIVGGSQFIHLFRDVFGLPGSRLVDIEVAGDLILKGLCGEPPARLPEPGVEPLDIDRLAERYGIYSSVAGREARRRMLRAALRLLSEKSFREVKVYEVTGEAGYAVGMFYKVYNSKNDLLADLIAILGKTIRRYLTECTSTAGDPVEREILGTKCFLSFIERNSQIYRIVRESEYVDPRIAEAYYKPFVERYAARLAGSGVTAYSHESLAIALMGVNHVAGILGPMLGILDPKLIVDSMMLILPRGLLGLS